MQVGTAELAALLGLTPRQVTSLAEQGVLPKSGRGEWPLAETIQAYVRHKVQSEVSRVKRAASGRGDRLKEIRARREELKLAREERELVPLADAIFAMDQVAGTLALEVNNIPARFTRDLDERERLQGEIDDALHKVAARIERCGRELKLDSDELAPADAEDA